MFSWICPKCGREVPPAYSECPTCAPAGKGDTATAGLSPAAPPPPPVPVETPPPLPPPRAAAPSVVVSPPTLSPLVVPVPAAPPASSRVAVPGWLLSVMFGLVFIVILLAVVVWRQSRQAAPAPAPSKAAQIESAEAVPKTQANAEFKDLELVGFRLAEDEKQKAFVQFTVVNHSGADLGEIVLHVELKAITARDKQTVGTFEFKTSLNAYEAKDLKVPLETKLRVYELPDWQFLRAEIAGRSGAE